MRRRILLSIAVLLAGMVAIVVTLPWWLGAVGARVGRSWGVTFARYERLGYGRFALSDVEYKRPGLRVVVSRLEADTPVLWGWRHQSRDDRQIVAADWRVEVVSTNTPPTQPPPERGWVPLRALLVRIGDQLDRWLPTARAGPGLVRFPGGEIALAAATWQKRQLTATGVAYRALKADATIAFTANDTIGVALKTTDESALPLAAQLQSRGAEATGNVAMFDQPATLTATFGPQGWLPRTASLAATDWNIPADKLKLGQAYSAVHGTAQIEWQVDRFSANIRASGDPKPGTPAPPLEIIARGDGDTAAFRIESLDAVLPGITARLSEPVTVERNGKIQESAARFIVRADLAKQPWFAATGAVEGEARLVSGVAASPQVEFSLTARDVTARDVKLTSIDARGRFEWPRIVMTEAAIVGGEGERLTAKGGWDFRAKEILDASIDGEIRRPSIARWLPKQPEFETVKISAQATGTVDAFQHSGKLSADGVKPSGMNPLALKAEWNGAGAAIEHFKAEASVANSTVSAVGSLAGEAVRLTALEFTQGGTTRLKLESPATIRWRPQLELESLHLAGGTSNLTAAGSVGEKGHLEISAANISSDWLTDFLPARGPAWQLTLLALIGSWDRGPMVFSVSAGATVEIGQGRMASAVLSGRGDKQGLAIEALRAMEGDATVVNAVAHVPITFTPASPWMHIDVTGPVMVDATVAPNAAFWQKLADLSGVSLRDPQASAHIAGTWQKPEGNAILRAAGVSIDAKRISRPLPNLEALDIEVTGDRQGVALNKFSVRVEGQAVRASGRLPIPDGNWSTLFKDPLALAQKGGDLRLEIPQAEVSVFARFLPAVLAPKGSLQADVRYSRGGFEGYLKLRDAASRPLGPLGVLQEITADIALSGRKLALRGVTARSGGQPITLNGTIEFPEKAAPVFDVAMRGENIPFVRQTGLLLRGDVDLKLQTPHNAAPRLSGTVRLRDSLFLSDVRAFVPKGGGSSPLRRPPYFAIETAPVNTWVLAVDVTGEKFLRLRTPVFAGVASARFRLGGTLGEPRAIGEATIDEGSVRMPFASFSVMNGSVRITEADPFEPAIYLRASGRRYGYDLTMEIDGNASQPTVIFTSSPALDSEQVLLMVMTGAAPSNEINRSTTQRMANIGYFLGSSLLGSLGSDAADPDRLTIGSGEKISRAGKETYDIEYKLSDRWTLTGEYNEFDEYNAGVKWRVFRGKRAGENGKDAKK